MKTEKILSRVLERSRRRRQWRAMVERKKYLLELLRELLELDQRWSLTVFGVGCGG
jgi:hypothetical protein